MLPNILLIVESEKSEGEHVKINFKAFITTQSPTQPVSSALATLPDNAAKSPNRYAPISLEYTDFVDYFYRQTER